MMEKEKKLISNVYERECLYAVDNAHYRDRHTRALAWSEIGKDLGLPAVQCKDMWRKLRNCYLNAINRRQNNNKSIPKWKYEDEMSFLLPYIDVKQSENSSVEIHNQSPDLSFVSASYYDNNTDSAMSERDDSDEMILPEDTNNYMVKYEGDEEALEMTRKKHPVASGSHFAHAPPAQDDMKRFFLSICETTKWLPLVEQAKIKIELSKMVYEARIRQLEVEYKEASLKNTNDSK